MKQPTKAHARWQRMIAKENVKAAYLHAQHRVITARLEALETEPVATLELVQLKLDLKEAS